ncbi:hypothetical protein EGT09_21290 [Pseudomonas putida]|nr:hypothetical protein EGT09_21290 [Pseudomonas putida]
MGAGLPANAMLNPPSHSRVNPLPQGAMLFWAITMIPTTTVGFGQNLCYIPRPRFPCTPNRSLTCKQPNHSTTIPSTGPNASGQRLSCR